MNKIIKIAGIILAIAVLFVIINIVIVQNWHSKMPLSHQRAEEHPALVYLCTIQNGTAFFDKILYSDKSIPIAYSKGDVVPTFSNLDITYKGLTSPEAIIIVVDKKTLVSGPITNHIVNEYFVRNGIVEGLGNMPLDKAIEWASRISENAGH